MRFLFCLCISLFCLTSLAHAQEDEESGGLLVDLLQDNLSGDNRYIKVTGLEGALSGAATIKQITVSDDDGVWLTLNDAVLDWNRLALIKGQFSVNTLSAGEIIVARAPKPTDAPKELPEAAASPFQVPELPVAIDIGDLRVDRLQLDKPVVGRAAELSLNGSLNLADGTLASKLTVTRLDKETDELDLTVGFANETSLITLDLKLTESADGLVSEILNIPDRPSILLTAKGEGPVTDFTADITLASDDVERLGGQVRLKSVPAPSGEDDAAPSIGFEADLAGDITPLLASQYKTFFGDNTSLRLFGRSDPDGRLAVQKFAVRSEALNLEGALDLAGGGVVERVLLDGRISPPQGEEVVLPIGEPRTSIRSAVLSAQLDTSKGNSWSINMNLNGLERPDLTLSRAEVIASGTLDQTDSMHLTGDIKAALRGIGLTDEHLKKAVGSQILLKGGFEAIDEKALKLSGFLLRGSNYTATVDAEIDGLDSGFNVDGTASVQADDLSRFSGLAGRDLTGAVEAEITGSGAPLGGSFDFDLSAVARDPSIGIKQVDNLIRGTTRLVLQAARDQEGLTIRRFNLNGTALTADAKGTVKSGDTNFSFNAKLDNLARVIPKLSGPFTITGDATQTDTGFKGKVRAHGPNGSFATLDGVMSPEGAIDVDYDATIGEIERFVPQVVGAVRAQGRAERQNDAWTVSSRINGPTGSRADLKGTMDAKGKIDVTYDATLARIERFAPQFPGTASAKGTATREDELWTIDTEANGPAGISAKVAGSVNQETFDADVTAKGQVQIGVINQFIKPNSLRGLARFDLALKGPAAVESLSGSIVLADGAVALPDIRQAVSDLDAKVSLSGGRATVTTTAGFQAGGQISVNGPVTLAPPFDTSMVIDITRLVLTDNVAIESSADGQLTFKGALTGKSVLAGEVRFGETNINIATMAGSVGSAPIPPMTHIGETRAERATRDWAGLVDTDKNGNGSSGPDIGLNIRLAAPDKIFVRGRGLQAELGGDILVRGTVDKVEPAGQIGLIRGSFAILGRRLQLTKGIVTLQGSLSPYMEFQATTSTSDGDATLEIAGPLDAPKVTVYSDPERPSEEALAMLVFGDQFSELSPIKIAQLAASLAQLSGGGGGGVGEDIRKGLGVDTLDLGTDSSGAAQFGAGRYLADGVYTDLSINAKGDTELNLNLDLTDDVTVKGTVDNTGETALGIFFERDY